MPRLRRPKLGQHFLADARYPQRIVETLDIRPEELVIEIGAGRGAMTELLAERARHLVAIELDGALAELLQRKQPAGFRIEVLCADVLTVDIGELCRRQGAPRCFVFGNLPYYITSPIIHHLFLFRDYIRAIALLMQREVAERLAAAPGTRAYGYLSVLTQLLSHPRVVTNVPAGAFSPPPRVQSALVEIRIRTAADTESLLPKDDVDKFLQFVKRCFEQKRKSLFNNLDGTYPRTRLELEFDRLLLAHSVRAEQLAVEELVRLYRHLST
jgi:16S rRNA (adenine1518-N6/adenine1519-N6)-dimethyltransferase